MLFTLNILNLHSLFKKYSTISKSCPIWIWISFLSLKTSYKDITRRSVNTSSSRSGGSCWQWLLKKFKIFLPIQVKAQFDLGFVNYLIRYFYAYQLWDYSSFFAPWIRPYWTVSQFVCSPKNHYRICLVATFLFL